MKGLYPSAEMLKDFKQLLDRPDLDAVVIATLLRLIIRSLKNSFRTASTS